MVSPEDFSKIVADKYRPIFYFMVVIFGAVIYGGHWIIRGYNIYADQLQVNIELKKEIAKLKAHDVVTTKQIGRMIQAESDSLKAMFARHDLNGDMAEEGLSDRRKKHYQKRLKQQLKDEMQVLRNAEKVAQ